MHVPAPAPVREVVAGVEQVRDELHRGGAGLVHDDVVGEVAEDQHVIVGGGLLHRGRLVGFQDRAADQAVREVLGDVRRVGRRERRAQGLDVAHERRVQQPRALGAPPDRELTAGLLEVRERDTGRVGGHDHQVAGDGGEDAGGLVGARAGGVRGRLKAVLGVREHHLDIGSQAGDVLERLDGRHDQGLGRVDRDLGRGHGRGVVRDLGEFRVPRRRGAGGGDAVPLVLATGQGDGPGDPADHVADAAVGKDQGRVQVGRHEVAAGRVGADRDRRALHLVQEGRVDADRDLLECLQVLGAHPGQDVLRPRGVPLVALDQRLQGVRVARRHLVTLRGAEDRVPELTGVGPLVQVPALAAEDLEFIALDVDGRAAAGLPTLDDPVRVALVAGLSGVLVRFLGQLPHPLNLVVVLHRGGQFHLQVRDAVQVGARPVDLVLGGGLVVLHLQDGAADLRDLVLDDFRLPLTWHRDLRSGGDASASAALARDRRLSPCPQFRSRVAWNRWCRPRAGRQACPRD